MGRVGQVGGGMRRGRNGEAGSAACPAVHCRAGGLSGARKQSNECEAVGRGPTQALTHSPSHSLILSLTHFLTLSLTHCLTLSLAQSPC